MADAMHDAKQERGSYRRIELITGEHRQRRWTAEDEARIVAESFKEGANISEVARERRLRETVWPNRPSKKVDFKETPQAANSP
jgi:transposase